jgi:hypothetical protein
MVAPKWLLAAPSLNHSRAVPALCVGPVQALRTYSLRLRVEPAGNPVGANGPKGMASSLALLKPLPPPATLLSCPEATRVPSS